MSCAISGKVKGINAVRVVARDNWPDWRQLEEDEEGTDVWAFVRGFITVTPMTLDVTGYAEAKRLG